MEISGLHALAPLTRHPGRDPIDPSGLRPSGLSDMSEDVRACRHRELASAAPGQKMTKQVTTGPLSFLSHVYSPIVVAVLGLTAPRRCQRSLYLLLRKRENGPVS